MNLKKKIFKLNKQFPIIFVSLWAIAMVSFIVTAVMNQLQLGAQIFISALWLIFAISNLNMFLTGRISHGRYGPMIARVKNPLLFGTVAGFYTIFSMSLLSFMLMKAFSQDFQIAKPHEGRTRQIKKEAEQIMDANRP